MASDRTPARSTDLTRRRVLTGVGAAAVTTLAGCEETVDPIPEDEQADLTLETVRVVQTVEDSGIRFGGSTLPDPPLVADEYAVVLFDLSITRPENLPDTVPVTVATPTTNFDYTQVLTRADLQAIANGADPAAAFHQTANLDRGGDPPDPQRLPADITEITVDIVESNVDGDSVTLTAGSDGDFQVTTVPPLRVGFIPLQDPGATNSPVYPTRSAATDQGDQYTTDIDWGDANGDVATYDRSVRSSLTYLRHVYPGPVVAYSHDAADPMVGVIRENWNDGTGKDAARARRALNWIRTFSTFPGNGTIHTDADYSRTDVVDMLDASEGGAFDVRVMILPRGTHGDHEDYFDAHGMTTTVGYFWSTGQAVSSLAAETGGDDNDHVQITAQEIAHRYAATPYSGSFAASASDQAHASNSLVSTAYTLQDGTYDLVNDWSITDGSLDILEDLTQSGQLPEIFTQTTYMQPTVGGDGWADARVQAYLIDGSYSPGYSGGTPRQSPPADPASPRHALRSHPRVQPTFEATATVVDDRVRVRSSTVYDAIPQSPTDRDGHPDATPVTVTIEDPAGEVLTTATVPDTHRGSHGDRRHGTVAISVPFPDRGVRLRADRDGITTALNPIVHPLRDAVERVPAAALETATDRDRLLADLAVVAAGMDRGDYDRALEALRTFDGRRTTLLAADYATTVSQPGAEQVGVLTERMLARLADLADPASDTVTLTFPDGTTDEIKPLKAGQSIAEYYGYDRSPRDSSSTPDGLEREDATVTFLYENTDTGRVSLVCLNGDPRTSTDGGGKAILTFEGVAGATWLVQDGTPGTGAGDQDPYETPDGDLRTTESVIWGWDDSKSDGGAIGPLGPDLDVAVRHRARGTVRDSTAEREGLDRWLFVDGDRPEDPLELVAFDAETGDVSIELGR